MAAYVSRFIRIWWVSYARMTKKNQKYHTYESNYVYVIVRLWNKTLNLRLTYLLTLSLTKTSIFCRPRCGIKVILWFSLIFIQEYQRELSLNTALQHELRQLKHQETSLLKLLLDHLASCPAPESALAALQTGDDVSPPGTSAPSWTIGASSGPPPFPSLPSALFPVFHIPFP